MSDHVRDENGNEQATRAVFHRQDESDTGPFIEVAGVQAHLYLDPREKAIQLSVHLTTADRQILRPGGTVPLRITVESATVWGQTESTNSQEARGLGEPVHREPTTDRVVLQGWLSEHRRLTDPNHAAPPDALVPLDEALESVLWLLNGSNGEVGTCWYLDPEPHEPTPSEQASGIRDRVVLIRLSDAAAENADLLA